MQLKSLQIIILLYLIPCSSVSSQNFIWANHTIGNQNIVGNAIGIDLQGNVYTSGYIWGTVGFNLLSGPVYLTSAGSSDIFITKQNSSGDFIWAKLIGGGGGDWTNCLSSDESGNFYIAGLFNDSVDFDPGPTSQYLRSNINGMFVCKYDSSCNLIWARQLSNTTGGGSGQPLGIAVAKTNEVFIAGGFSDTIDFNPGIGIFNLASNNGVLNSFVLKLDSSGNFIWASQIGYGCNNCFMRSLAIDSSYNVITCGNYFGIGDFDPDTSIYLLPNGEAYLSKLDSAGHFVFAKTFGDSFGIPARIESITTDRDNRIFITGNISDSLDFDPASGTYYLNSARLGHPNIFIARYDSSGLFNWAEVIRDSASDGAKAITTDNQSLFITGSLEGPADFNPQSGTYYLTKCGSLFDSYILKLTLEGDFIWAKQICGMTEVQSNAIAVDNSGSVYVTGYFRDSADFDPSSTSYYLAPSYPYPDLFVLKLGLPTGLISHGEMEAQLTLYPNPSSATIRITCDKNFISQIRIYNSLGSLVTNCEFKNVKEAEIDVSKLSGGIYIAMIELENGWRNIKFVKK